MKIIISPAEQMREDTDMFTCEKFPGEHQHAQTHVAGLDLAVRGY